MSNPYDTAEPGKASVLGPTLTFKGDLTAEEELMIEGSFEGSIKHSSKLTICESGRVKGNVAAEHVAVEGYVEGDIHGAQSITISETANINGNISSPKVSLLEGATFNGKIDMSGKTKLNPEAADPVVADETATGDEAAPG